MKREPNPWRSVARAAFVVYTAALLTATHWPGLTVSGPIDRSDLVIHCGAFFIWTCLLYLSRLIGGECQRRRLVWAIVAGLCFAVLDETTQPLQPFNRQFDWFDLLADGVGVVIAGGLILAARRLLPRFLGSRG